MKSTFTQSFAAGGLIEGSACGIVDGPGGHMALNVNYLADALNAITTPQVALETEGALRPAVLKPVGAEGFVHVIMPMNLP